MISREKKQTFSFSITSKEQFLVKQRVSELHLVHEPRVAVIRSSLRENVTAGVCDEQRLLKLSREESVLGDGGPVVWPLFVPPSALRNHRLNREHVSCLHHADGSILCGRRDLCECTWQRFAAIIQTHWRNEEHWALCGKGDGFRGRSSSSLRCSRGSARASE